MSNRIKKHYYVSFQNENKYGEKALTSTTFNITFKSHYALIDIVKVIKYLEKRHETNKVIITFLTEIKNPDLSTTT